MKYLLTLLLLTSCASNPPKIEDGRCYKQTIIKRYKAIKDHKNNTFTMKVLKIEHRFEKAKCGKSNLTSSVKY